MPANPILICAPSPDLRSRLEQLREAGYATTTVDTAADAVSALRAGPFDLIVAEGLAVSGAIARIRGATAKQVPLIVVSPAGDVEARIAFLEAGADDVIAASFASTELEARVEALLIRTGKARPEGAAGGGAGKIVTFFSPKGGVGTTTLAVNSAVLLAGGPAAMQGNAARVLLVDLDLQFGQVATHLNLSPRYDIADLCSDEQALADPALAAGYLAEHASGVSVLAGPSNPEADFRVTVDQLEKAFRILRPSFDHVLVDCGSRLDPRSLWMLEQADTHVFVIFPEIAALRATTLMLGFLAETATLRATTHFVVNHIFPRELLKTRDVENLLRAKPVAEIPYTEVDMIRAVNEGVPVVFSRPSSPASQAIQVLTVAIVGAEWRQRPSVKKGQTARRGGLRLGRR
ncbi:MAG TPA: AAA family ATPase [Candidatus Limnocylindria bacterium]|nr:AAA family ATPase [Candidatus Limnocylindria bacterium]